MHKSTALFFATMLMMGLLVFPLSLKVFFEQQNLHSDILSSYEKIDELTDNKLSHKILIKAGAYIITPNGTKSVTQVLENEVIQMSFAAIPLENGDWQMSELVIYNQSDYNNSLNQP